MRGNFKKSTKRKSNYLSVGKYLVELQFKRRESEFVFYFTLYKWCNGNLMLAPLSQNKVQEGCLPSVAEKRKGSDSERCVNTLHGHPWGEERKGTCHHQPPQRTIQIPLPLFSCLHFSPYFFILLCHSISQHFSAQNIGIVTYRWSAHAWSCCPLQGCSNIIKLGAPAHSLRQACWLAQPKDPLLPPLPFTSLMPAAKCFREEDGLIVSVTAIPLLHFSPFPF